MKESKSTNLAHSRAATGSVTCCSTENRTICNRNIVPQKMGQLGAEPSMHNGITVLENKGTNGSRVNGETVLHREHGDQRQQSHL
jgi:hypothetical protein